jgi:hypothetical protein
MDESSKILHPRDAEHSSLLCVSYVLDADLFDRASIGIAASATTARTRDARAGLAIWTIRPDATGPAANPIPKIVS